MNILAVDTAGKTAAVAVLRDDVLLYEAPVQQRPDPTAKRCCR